MKKHFFAIFIFCNLLTLSVLAQVGINTTTPNDNSILDLDSNNKGLLIPRLTKAEMSALDATLTSTDAGMLVYCTDLKLFCYYDGSDWISMPAWGQKVDLSDPTAEQNISPTIMNSNSGVGIGTLAPQSKFTVLGNLAVGKDSIAPTDGAYVFGKVRMGVNAGINNQLEVGGSINARGKIKENGYDLVPAGTIVLWYGSTGSIPDGWAWCNGGTATWETGGNFTTPDLSGRFVMGAGNRDSIVLNGSGGNDTYTVGEMGGYDKVGLLLAEMPAHNHGGGAHHHNIPAPNDKLGNPDGAEDEPGPADMDNMKRRYWRGIEGTTTTTSNPPGDFIVSNGGNSPHENCPPYYVLAYIIKL